MYFFLMILFLLRTLLPNSSSCLFLIFYLIPHSLVLSSNISYLGTLPDPLLPLSRFSHVRLCVTPEMAAHQAPPSLGFSRQEHWSELPFLSPFRSSHILLFHTFTKMCFFTSVLYNFSIHLCILLLEYQIHECVCVCVYVCVCLLFV